MDVHMYSVPGANGQDVPNSCAYDFGKLLSNQQYLMTEHVGNRNECPQSSYDIQQPGNGQTTSSPVMENATCEQDEPFQRFVGKYSKHWKALKEDLGFDSEEVLVGYLLNVHERIEAMGQLPPTQFVEDILDKNAPDPYGQANKIVNVVLKVKTSVTSACHLLVQNGTISECALSAVTETNYSVQGNVDSRENDMKYPYSLLKIVWTPPSNNVSAIQMEDVMSCEENASNSISNKGDGHKNSGINESRKVKEFVNLKKNDDFIPIKDEAETSSQSIGQIGSSFEEDNFSENEIDDNVRDSVQINSFCDETISNIEHGYKKGSKISNMRKSRSQGKSQRKSKPRKLQISDLEESSSVKKQKSGTDEKKKKGRPKKLVKPRENSLRISLPRVTIRDAIQQSESDGEKNIANVSSDSDDVQSDPESEASVHSDYSETASDIIRRIQSNSKKSMDTKYKVEYFKCAKESTVLRDFTFTRNPNRRQCMCYICGFVSYSGKMILHLHYIHHETMKAINDKLDMIQRKAKHHVTIKSNIKSSVKLNKSEVMCLVCNEVCETKVLQRHLKENHAIVNTESRKQKRLKNYGATEELLIVLDRNMIEFDHLSSLYFCKVCDEQVRKPYKDRKTILKHIEKHNEKRLTCVECSVQCDNDQQLRSHTSKDHRKHQEFWACDKCDFLTVGLINVEEHLRVVHPSELQCTENDCNYVCYSTSECRRHIIAYHTIDGLGKEFSKPLASGEVGIFGGAKQLTGVRISLPCIFCDEKISGDYGNAKGNLMFNTTYHTFYNRIPYTWVVSL